MKTPRLAVRFVANRLALLLAVLALGPAVHAGGIASVAMSSTAGPAYIRPTDAQGKPAPETYIFMQGHHLSGGGADASENKMSFATITKFLALNLAKQNYFPTRDVPTANLVITVHWGTTQIYEDPRGKEFITEQMNKEIAAINADVQEGGIADSSGLNQALSETETTQSSQESAINRNAELLGYIRTLAKERRKVAPTADELTMSTELNEERYFVILMAYDYQFMRREKKPKLLWVTRLSVRAPGTNFTEALPTLAVAGAEVFGRQLDGLVRAKVPVQDGKVILHDLQVLGTQDNAAAAQAAPATPAPAAKSAK